MLQLSTNKSTGLHRSAGSTVSRLLECQLLQHPGALFSLVQGLPPLRLQVAAAVADVSALEKALTPAALTNEFSHDIAAAPLLIVDTNLSPAALQVGMHCDSGVHALMKCHVNPVMQLRSSPTA
jgi:hypothetical protein